MKSLVLALTVSTAMVLPAFAQDGIKEFNIGVMGGENAQDRMTANACLQKYAEEALGVPV